MKQWTTLMDGIDQIQLREVQQDFDVGEDEVLVKISRVSLNNRDVKITNGDFKGRYQTPTEPVVPTSDASGIIVSVGKVAAYNGWQEGMKVIGLVRPTHSTGATKAEHSASGIGFPRPGVLTEFRKFSAAGLVEVPKYMTLDEACTLPVASITAWMAINWDRPLNQPRRGRDVVVLLQGTGGVSISALQQAKALQLTTIITSSSDAKLQRARELGADHTINYKNSPDWAEEVLKLTNGKGTDVIVETGGPDTMEQSLKAVAEGGNISAVGILTGVTDEKPRMTIGLSLITRNATLKGINVGPKDRIEEMLDVYSSNEIHPVIDRTFEFEEAKEALQYMKDGSHFGKVVLKVDSN